MKNYLGNEMIRKALNSGFTDGISGQRKVVLFAVKHHMYRLLFILGKVRRAQKAKL